MIKTVLVEDEETVRREISLTTPWHDLGCLLIGEAANGIDGLALIMKVRPDLVITDIRMPGLDGLAMLEEVEEQLGDEKPKAILLTGHTDFEYARKGIRLGVCEYLLKPIDDDEFHSLLKNIADELDSVNTSSQEKEGSPILLDFKEYDMNATGDSKDYYVRKAVQIIGGNYSRDISMADVADQMRITQGYLSRVFKERTGYTFLEYLTLFRLRKAVELLRDRSLLISEAAYRSGFHDNGYFTQLFKKYTGVTPGQYRKGGFLN